MNKLKVQTNLLLVVGLARLPQSAPTSNSLNTLLSTPNTKYIKHIKKPMNKENT